MLIDKVITLIPSMRRTILKKYAFDDERKACHVHEKVDGLSIHNQIYEERNSQIEN